MLAPTAIMLQVLQSVTKCYHGICSPKSSRVYHRIFDRKMLRLAASIPCVLVAVISEHVEHLGLVLTEALHAVVLRHHLVLLGGH